MINYRYDEFLGQDLSVLLTGESIKIPSGSPYYVSLNEVPREETPSTLLVRAAGTATTVNPDQDCGVDQNNPGTNNNTGTATVGRYSAVSGGQLARIFMRFDIAALPAVASVAKIRVYSQRPPQASVVGLHKVTSTWTETGPTWTSQPTYDAVPAGQYSLPGGGTLFYAEEWYEADITGLYNAWKSSGVNYGLMLKADESVFDTFCNINTKDTGFPAYKPQLVVVGSGNAYKEVSRSVTPASGEFAVHYGTGRLRFHSSAAGLTLDCDYRGQGSPIDAQHTTFWAGTTAGSGTAFTATLPSVTRLAAGQSVQAKVHTANTGAATLNVNGLGAISILRLGAALTASQLLGNVVYSFLYDGTSFHVQGV